MQLLIKKIKSHLTLLSVAILPAYAGNVTPQDAELWLKTHDSELLEGSDTDHVMSYYFFGTNGHRTLIGLERVRGDDFTQHYYLMVFDDTRLLGYYPDIATMPLMLSESGVLEFPRGYDVSDTILIQQDEFPPLCLGEFGCSNWRWQAETEADQSDR
ncbi:hypothetical protein [Thalassolituus sp.]|uniref:hypothetical protein n=1 Tax=Thalassolituus sp. TaxID=2030822 RepID=UPI003513C038|nr:MAG: hypothetical protein CSH36_04925 [Thalassolituus sp.]